MNIKENDGRFLKPAGDRKMRRAWNELGKVYSRMKYNKLVRDKIPDIIKKRGGKPKIHIAGNDEYWRKLKEKLKEEVGEFLGSASEEEMADILEVIDAILNSGRINKKKTLSFQKKKAKKRGRFKKRIILEES